MRVGKARVRLAVVALAAAALGLAIVWPASGASSHSSPQSSSAQATSALPPIKHVFIIVLENENGATTFGPGTPAPYLAQTLTAQGAYVPNYFGIGHSSLDNYTAMISGQPPNPRTQADCTGASDNVTPDTFGSYGASNGNGCQYPADVPTLAGQLTTAGLTWGGYMDSMGLDPAREAATCAHPAVGVVDPSVSRETTPPYDEYATRHDPFVYFHSITDDAASCNSHVVNLSQLPAALSSVATTPNYTFITPGVCNDGHDSGCHGDNPVGLAQADSFLQTWVPQITGSPAFKQDGLLLITFDEGVPPQDTACCGEIPGPAAPNPGGGGPGGGQVGAVLLSPFIKPGTVSQTSYNHYSMLGSIEDLFGLSHIGYAQLPGETDFGADIYTNPPSTTSSTTSTTSTTTSTTTTTSTSTTPAPTPPVSQIAAPPLLSAASARARVPLSWSASASSGLTIRSFTVQSEDLSAKHPAWRTILSSTSTHSANVPETPGHTVIFRVRATDSAGTVGAFASSGNTVVPSGTRPDKGHYDRHWHKVKARGGWLGHAMESSTPGAMFTLTYKGGALDLIGETGPTGGTVTVKLDGRHRTLHLHSATTHRRLVLTSFAAKTGRHHLTITVRHGETALEGFAITKRTG